jgi:MTH538 TIR-like domain (DUF1863)
VIVARKVFFSFHYLPDSWRASQVRNIGVVEGNSVATDNDWETVKAAGDVGIQRWINSQLEGRSCTIVLIGSETANRKWVKYEIEQSWNKGMAVLGVHIHNLKDRHGQQLSKGKNPFSTFTVGAARIPMTEIVHCYDPPYSISQFVYEDISNNLESLIENAISDRKKY